MKEHEEYELIKEYCYHEKQSSFVVRFLDGSSYTIKISDLPKKLQTKKPIWTETSLSTAKTSLVVRAGNDYREIPSHIIHARGKLL
jgi:hypothetical protein